MSLALGVFFQLVIWWYVARRFGYLEQPIFLHYNVIFGVDLVGEWWKIWLFPVAGLAVLLVNFLIAYFCYAVEVLLARFVAVGAVLFELLIFIAVVHAAGLNL